MASAALPAWLSDVPGDTAWLFETLAVLREHKHGRSILGMCCGSEVVEEAELEENKPWWQDQCVVSIHRLPSHVPLRLCEGKTHALARRICDVVPVSKWILPLTPSDWDFALFPCPNSAPRPKRESKGFDTSSGSWGSIHVPLSWEVAGHSHAIYLNTLYPFPITPPRVPTTDNPVGCYQRTFEVPADWAGRRVILHLDGIGSACLVYIDGLPVGYSQDGKLAAEFDVTATLCCAACGGSGTAVGLHTVSLQVLRWSDGSYLECQDTWRLSGIQRHCWLYSPHADAAICDYHAATDLLSGDEVGAAALSVDVRLDGALAEAALAASAASGAGAADALLGGIAVRATLLGPFVMESYDSPPACGPVVWTATATPSLVEMAHEEKLSWAPNVAPCDPSVRPAGQRGPTSHSSAQLREPGADGTLLSGPLQASFRTVLPSPLLWSAERPWLYTLVLEVERVEIDRGGDTVAASAAAGTETRSERADRSGRAANHVLGVETCWLGVRSLSVVDGILMLNRRRLTICGANVTEFDPEGGRALSWRTMVRDAELLKASNMNAVRLAHCPFPEAWYDLCDAVGLLVVDESNIETHGCLFLGNEGLLARWPSWRKAYMQRLTRMVQRDKNRPSVLWWSLGNESGYGPTHDHMAAWCRKHDPRRLVFYESCGAGAATDVLCPMYYAKHLVAKMDTLSGQVRPAPPNNAVT